MWPMTDGDHGQLYLRGEHTIGHGVGEELDSSQVQLVDNDRETEDLRYQNAYLSGVFLTLYLQ